MWTVLNGVKQFFFTFAALFPVVITVADEVGIPAKINGKSMQPSFNPATPGRWRKWYLDDFVWVNCLNMRIRRCHSLQPGDVVALRSPVDPDDVLIKRIIATPGQTIMKRKYDQNVTIPPSHYWVEGDNFEKSEDSNSFGPISEGLVLGLISYILWPPQRAQQVKNRLTPEQIRRSLAINL